MSNTHLEFTSFRPGSGPVEMTIDDDVAADRLQRRDRAMRSAGPAQAGRPGVAPAAAAGAVWRQRGVLDLEQVAKLTQATTRRTDPAHDPFEPCAGKWAAVVLRDDASAAQAALAPLLALRQSEGIAFDRHGGTPGLVVLDRPAADKPHVWEEALRGVTGSPPHHLLLVGGPERFPFEVTTWWSARRIVGVLDVADDPLGPLAWPAVQRYASKVRDAAAASAAARRALVYAFRTDTATRRSHDKLAVPLLRYLDEQRSRLPAPAGSPISLLGDQATTCELLRTMRTERPSLLFLCTHGIEFPPEPRHWGALTSVDHDAAGAPLSVDSIASGEPFAEHGVVFAFACFSAGVPATSAVMELVAPGSHGEAQVPRIAELPRIALGQPRGPLAFIGHVDRASTNSFSGYDGVAAFRDLADFVLAGLGTVGQGMTTFWEEANRAAADLAAVLADDTSTPQQRVAAWVRRVDTAGWALLGDPCVRVFPRAAG